MSARPRQFCRTAGPDLPQRRLSTVAASPTESESSVFVRALHQSERDASDRPSVPYSFAIRVSASVRMHAPDAPSKVKRIQVRYVRTRPNNGWQLAHVRMPAATGEISEIRRQHVATVVTAAARRSRAHRIARRSLDWSCDHAIGRRHGDEMR
jgi:hypothetical protein